jgi:hypothetical protein
MLLSNTAYPVFVSIQPNFAWSQPDRVNRGDGPTMVRNLLRDLFYRLDRDHTGCPKPEYLPPISRFNGFVVVEKPKTSPHAHVLISCVDGFEQLGQALTLFKLLDNVTMRTDQEWAESAWRFVTAYSAPHESRTDRKYSLLTGLAPAGTAMVQRILGAADHERVARYMTKTCYQSGIGGEDLDFFELRDFFPVIPKKLHARLWSPEERNPNHHVLDLDKPLKYRVSGRGILR